MSTENTPGMKLIKVHSVMWEVPISVAEEIDRLTAENERLNRLVTDYKDSGRARDRIEIEKLQARIERLESLVLDAKRMAHEHGLTEAEQHFEEAIATEQED